MLSSNIYMWYILISFPLRILSFPLPTSIVPLRLSYYSHLHSISIIIIINYHHPSKSRFHKWTRACDIWLFELGLSHSIWYFKFHLFSCKWHNSIFPYDWVIIHDIYVYMHNIYASIYRIFFIHHLLGSDDSTVRLLWTKPR
jgi:hypothetical protein